VSTDIDVIRGLLDELEVAHPTREIAFDQQAAGRGSWDPDRLAQLVSNLVSNALHYSPEGTPVRVTLREEGDRVRLAVHNAGSPIPPELLPHIFDPFRRGAQEAEAQSAAPGLGLGLFIAREIAKAHGGTIEVTSDATSGTTFLVSLPRGG
jgi:signal transduction histidine kinase